LPENPREFGRNDPSQPLVEIVDLRRVFFPKFGSLKEHGFIQVGEFWFTQMKKMMLKDG